jgi:uncharacterized protein YbaR (Trm112 family)
MSLIWVWACPRCNAQLVSDRAKIQPHKLMTVGPRGAWTGCPRCRQIMRVRYPEAFGGASDPGGGAP